MPDREYLNFTIELRKNRQRALDSYGLRELKRLAGIELDIFISQIAAIREEERHANMERDYLGQNFFDTLMRSNPEKIFSTAREVQKKLLALGIVHGTPRTKIQENIHILYPELNIQEQYLISKLLERSTLSNMRINWKKVDAIETQAMASVPKVVADLKAGQILAFKGEKVEAREYYLLKELNLLHPKTDWKQIRKNYYLIGACVLLLAILLKIFKTRKFLVQEVHMYFIVTTGIIAVIDLISLWGIDKLPLSPLAAITIILTVFYAPYIAGIAVTLIAFFLANSFDLNLWQVLPLYVGSIYAIRLARKAHQREDLSNAGIKVALVQVMVFGLTLVLAVGDFKTVTALSVAAMYAISGWSSGFIALALLPYLESFLGLLTPFKLAELANPNQPLLSKLREEAPGTYEHSLRVSRFSEEAGNAIGANTALIRTGLLYHDIGKTYRPDYFIENSFGRPNPHTTLNDPEESARIIIAHVPEGVKLAQKAHLPQAIIDFIPMHQGTTVANYFYIKALNLHGKNSVDREKFRYPGPKPNTRETGIAMMADSTEAALKSMTDIREESAAKAVIDRIIQSRIDEGELSDVNLSPDELEKIADAFLVAWRAMNHERIKYPDKIGGTR
jgi:putative nucleotidyltransferase with HDIG domain